MQDNDPLGKVLSELNNILAQIKDQKIHPGMANIPADIDVQLATLNKMLELFSGSANDALFTSGVDRNHLRTVIAHPELLSPQYKKLVEEATRLKSQAESIQQKSGEELQDFKRKRRTKKAKTSTKPAEAPINASSQTVKSTGTKTDAQVTAEQQRKKKFKSLGGSHWKPI